MKAAPTEKLKVSPITAEYMDNAREYIRKSDITTRRLMQEDPNRKISEIANSMIHFEKNSENFTRIANLSKTTLQKEYSPAAVADRTMISIRKIIDQQN